VVSSYTRTTFQKPRESDWLKDLIGHLVACLCAWLRKEELGYQRFLFLQLRGIFAQVGRGTAGGRSRGRRVLYRAGKGL